MGKNIKFLDCLDNHKYRYLDQTGLGRAPMSSNEVMQDFNLAGYEAYMTINGFTDGKDTKEEQCINLNTFFCDIDDGKKNPDQLKKIIDKLEPSFIIETGRGYHIYYLLDEPIYKSEVDNWDEIVELWKQIETSIVTEFDGDHNAKKVTQLARQPDTFYWKESGEQYKKGTESVFKIKGIHKNLACRYSIKQMKEAFPPLQIEQKLNWETHPTSDKAKKMAEAEKKNFFDMVNKEYPVEERESFKRLISAHPESLPHPNVRNNALLITATLMRQAGWTKEIALKQIEKVGWHGIEKERGGSQEIMNTLNSAYSSGYTYSYKNEIIAHNMSPEESQKIQMAYTAVLKKRKEQDKVRFSNYERELLAIHPYLKKNEIGIVFNYKNGVYKMMTDQEISDMVLNGLYEDMLWGYRTKKNVSDKVACLLSVIPLLVISNDGGYIANVKNGLLNIYTRELKPHTPDFVSLIQYPVVYDPEAKCPIWDKCVNEWMSGQEQDKKTQLLKQFSGYCLSSSMLYDRALFMVGDGGNGKSTFIDTIAMVIGHNATSHIDLEGLYGTFGMHGLIGKRLNIIEEVQGNYYQSNKLKKLISGEQVTIDIKYKPQFTFRPQAKFVFSVNLLPRVDDTSTATERRICAVQFLNNYRDNPNYELRSSIGLLAKELSGILNWMIEGAIDLAEKGNFVITEEQTRMLDEYRAENSSVEGFLSQCIVLDPESDIETPDLYAEYKKWCLSDGGRKMKANITFTKEVKAYGAKNNRFTFTSRSHAGTESKFIGISLSPHWVKSSNPYKTAEF